ncbi:hypothetical protein ABTL50_19965, partial [Acinetobacter baumannii]
QRLQAERDTAVAVVSPGTALLLEPGDTIRLADDPEPWRVTRVDAEAAPRLTLARMEASDGPGVEEAGFIAAVPVRPMG